MSGEIVYHHGEYYRDRCFTRQCSCGMEYLAWDRSVLERGWLNEDGRVFCPECRQSRFRLTPEIASGDFESYTLYSS